MFKILDDNKSMATLNKIALRITVILFTGIYFTSENETSLIVCGIWMLYFLICGSKHEILMNLNQDTTNE